MDGQGSRIPAQSLRPKPQRMDVLQQGFFKRGIKRVRVGTADGPEQGLLAEQTAPFKISPQPYSHHERRTGIRAGVLHGLHNPSADGLRRLRRIEHLKTAFILAAAALQQYA